MVQSRKIIKGGYSYATLTGAKYFIGESIADKINTFIAIAGGNYGKPSCMTSTVRICDKRVGMYPGTKDASDLSTFLKEINDNPLREADHTYAIYGVFNDASHNLMVFG